MSTAPSPAPSSPVVSMLLTIERRMLRAGGQQGALANARAAVREGQERAELRAAAAESLIRLGAVAE